MGLPHQQIENPVPGSGVWGAISWFGRISFGPGMRVVSNVRENFFYKYFSYMHLYPRILAGRIAGPCGRAGKPRGRIPQMDRFG